MIILTDIYDSNNNKIQFGKKLIIDKMIKYHICEIFLDIINIVFNNLFAKSSVKINSSDLIYEKLNILNKHQYIKFFHQILVDNIDTNQLYLAFKDILYKKTSYDLNDLIMIINNHITKILKLHKYDSVNDLINIQFNSDPKLISLTSYISQLNTDHIVYINNSISISVSESNNDKLIINSGIYNFNTNVLDIFIGSYNSNHFTNISIQAPKINSNQFEFETFILNNYLKLQLIIEHYKI